MDVDTNNDKGAYIISSIEQEVIFSKDKVMTWNDFERASDGRQNFGLFSSISPDGRYVISTVKDMPVYQPFPDPGYSQLFFPGRGILVVYDRQTKTFAPLPGASDPAHVQTNAVWSPDGNTIVFARAKALGNDFSTNDFVKRTAKFRFDLYRIPFNGGKGGTVEALSGASANSRSNYFPKFTPDGKWIVYTQSDAFMIIQPDAELHIVPASGGKDRRMRCNTEGKMASWHSIAPGGRWMVFSSKADGPYTRLWLTHLDTEGNDTPAVLLENFVAADKAANIPEFLNISPDKLKRIVNQLDN
jgi:dipeptidyl aminopeptidase/acylaminoacyl peptidase